MKLFAEENYWRWSVFLSKTYLFAMPIALLICWQLVPPAPADMPHTTDEPNTILVLIDGGYIVCFVVLLINAILAISTRDKNKIRPALIFAMLALISVIFFYPFYPVAREK